MDYDNDTKYVKPSSKKTPPKANHRHEYFRYVTWARIVRFDGSISDERYKRGGKITCIDCGNIRRYKGRVDFEEIEVSVKEFKQLV